MHVYREDVYFFLGGIHDGKDKKDHFIMYRHVAFFFKGREAEISKSKKRQSSKP